MHGEQYVLVFSILSWLMRRAGTTGVLLLLAILIFFLCCVSADAGAFIR